MKSLFRLSGLISFTAFLCFLPSAFGQGAANITATGGVPSVLTFKPSSFLAFALAPGNDLYKDGKGWNGGNGWNDGKGGKDPYVAAPEGGTPLMYLLLAGLSCLGGMVLRSRWQASMRETN